VLYYGDFVYCPERMHKVCLSRVSKGFAPSPRLPVMQGNYASCGLYLSDVTQSSVICYQLGLSTVVMDGSGGLHPRDSLSNFIGKRLEEIFPGRDVISPEPAQSPWRSWHKKQYMPVAPQYSANGPEREANIRVRRNCFGVMAKIR
jgi:hypothetical protein